MRNNNNCCKLFMNAFEFFYKILRVVQFVCMQIFYVQYSILVDGYINRIFCYGRSESVDG